VKSLTNNENPSVNLLQEACSGFPIAACDTKSCSESRLILKIVPEAGHECTVVHILEKIDQCERKKARTEI
jgi:hypothetical protein